MTAHRTTGDIRSSLITLLSELVDGAPDTGAYVLNRSDPGILRSLDRLSAAEASAKSPSGSSIAAHVDHVRYGFSLMNRWRAGENPWRDADWSASWKRTTVDDRQWADLRRALADETHRWLKALETPFDVDDVALKGVIGSIAHLAYHLGAIRQMNLGVRGPKEGESPG